MWGGFFFSEVVNIKYDLIYKKSKAVCVSKSCLSVSLSRGINRENAFIFWKHLKNKLSTTHVLFLHHLSNQCLTTAVNTGYPNAGLQKQIDLNRV